MLQEAASKGACPPCVLVSSWETVLCRCLCDAVFLLLLAESQAGYSPGATGLRRNTDLGHGVARRLRWCLPVENRGLVKLSSYLLFQFKVQ